MCGLKLIQYFVLLRVLVTPFVGVWIETPSLPTTTKHRLVTPFVGVWIETDNNRDSDPDSHVTPFVGVWIETEGNERCR